MYQVLFLILFFLASSIDIPLNLLLLLNIRHNNGIVKKSTSIIKNENKNRNNSIRVVHSTTFFSVLRPWLSRQCSFLVEDSRLFFIQVTIFIDLEALHQTLSIADHYLLHGRLPAKKTILFIGSHQSSLSLVPISFAVIGSNVTSFSLV